jgi:hypothetical protein
MSESSTIPVGVTVIQGRVERSRRNGKVMFTTLILPAPDQYSKPDRIEVRSDNAIGSVGEDVQVRCRLGGYAKRPFDYTDRETGEQRRVFPVENTLTAF